MEYAVGFSSVYSAAKLWCGFHFRCLFTFGHLAFDVHQAWTAVGRCKVDSLVISFQFEDVLCCSQSWSQGVWSVLITSSGPPVPHFMHQWCPIIDQSTKLIKVNNPKLTHAHTCTATDLLHPKLYRHTITTHIINIWMVPRNRPGYFHLDLLCCQLSLHCDWDIHRTPSHILEVSQKILQLGFLWGIIYSVWVGGLLG